MHKTDFYKADEEQGGGESPSSPEKVKELADYDITVTTSAEGLERKAIAHHRVRAAPAPTPALGHNLRTCGPGEQLVEEEEAEATCRARRLPGHPLRRRREEKHLRG